MQDVMRDPAIANPSQKIGSRLTLIWVPRDEHITTRYYLRKVEAFARHFRRPPDRLAPQHIREYEAPSTSLHKTEVVAGFDDHLSLGAAFFLHPDAQKAVEHCWHSPSEKGSPLAHDFEPGRSGAAHRCGEHALPSNSAHPPPRRLQFEPSGRSRKPRLSANWRARSGFASKTENTKKRPGMKAEKYRYVFGGRCFDRSSCNTMWSIYLRHGARRKTITVQLRQFDLAFRRHIGFVDSVRDLSAHLHVVIFWPAIGLSGSGSMRHGFSSVQPQIRHLPCSVFMTPICVVRYVAS